MPSLFAQSDERWERWANYYDDEDEARQTGIVLGTVFHFADFFVWSALVTGLVWLRDTHRKHRGVAAAAPHGIPASPLAL